MQTFGKVWEIILFISNIVTYSEYFSVANTFLQKKYDICTRTGK